MSENPIKDSNDKEKPEAPIASTPATDLGGKVDDYATTMWTNYQQEYLAAISPHCYDEEFDTLFNNAQVKNLEDLLRADPVWTEGKFVRKRLTQYQKEHIEELKAKMLDATRKIAIATEQAKNADSKVPPDYGNLNADRKQKEKIYYEESLPIMFNLQLKDDTKPRNITTEDSYRLEWESIKFAVDSVHLSFGKSMPKKAKTSRNLYT